MSSCTICQAELVATTWGDLCGACGLGAGLTDEQDVIGDYERFHLLGEGSMGAVYLAKHVASDEVVALKLAKRELLEVPGGLELFRQQAKIESALVHPSIVHVQGAGTHQEQPFLVMPLMEGGTLAEPDNKARYQSPRARLQLVLTIARAVQFAHARGVLHCDLKPENILFDAAGEPKVSDFGLARHLGSTGVADAEGVRGGTRGWMSPEQVSGAALTTASDVFALGVLLHWLETDKLPFGDGEDFEERVLNEPAPPLRRWTPELAWGLQAVAHRALQKKPAQRYGSAAALVEDLERLASERPLRGGAIPVWGRGWHWAQRHPGARNAIFLLLPAFALLALFMAASQRADLRRAVLDMNAYAASGQAAAVLYQLREYADTVERAAADPAVSALTHGSAAAGQDPCSTQTALEDSTPLVPYAEKFATLLVLDTAGCPRARISEEPVSPSYVRTSFDWRDYFSSALADAERPTRTTHVRKAYRSSVSQLIKFAVSTPLFEDGKWVGVIAGSMTAASTLGLPRMKRSETQDQMTVLLGPFEGERTGPRGARTTTGATEFTFLVHPRLGHGQKVILDAATAASLEHAFRPPGENVPQFALSAAKPLERADYRDPLLGDGFLAAFAPVGATGYVVLVQTRDSVAIRPSNTLSRSALALALGSVALVLLYSSFFVWRWRRERQR
jgi:eukaryotic-like serine/threonine-protein kinase